VPSYLVLRVLLPSIWSVVHTSVSSLAGLLYSISILSLAPIVYALVRVNVCPVKDVGRLEASIVSLKVATMVSLELLATARTVPEADPALLRRTVQLFRD
jgi:hypothetical protein